jgi:RimJ/RimL family protein N-acetyltransferase
VTARLDVIPVTLEGRYVRLEPLTHAHADALVAAASDGELWNSPVTVVPDAASVSVYIDCTLEAQREGRELPFAIVRRSSGVVVGSTRFRSIDRVHVRAEIGSTWLSAGAQRTAVNTEAKLLLLQHAFDYWGCIRVELLTDVLNSQSRAAILRLGATEEGVLRNHMRMPGGRLRDSACYSIIPAEWPLVRAHLEARLRD